MILNSPLVYDLTLGQTERTPTQEDTVMVVPATIMPVVDTLLPHQENLNVSVPFSSSFVIDANQSRSASQSQLTSLICTLAAGLWELEMVLTSWFSYDMTAVLPSFNSILITFFGNQRHLLPHFAAVGSITTSHRVRILTRLDLSVSLRNGDTQAGQGNHTRMSLNAVRIL